MAMQSKVNMVLNLKKASDRGFEFRLKHGCMSVVFCVDLSYVGTGLTMSPYPVKKLLSRFIVPQVTSESDYIHVTRVQKII
jgi:hypothetical protein